MVLIVFHKMYLKPPEFLYRHNDVFWDVSVQHTLHEGDQCSYKC